MSEAAATWQWVFPGTGAVLLVIALCNMAYEHRRNAREGRRIQPADDEDDEAPAAAVTPAATCPSTAHMGSACATDWGTGAETRPGQQHFAQEPPASPPEQMRYGQQMEDESAVQPADDGRPRRGRRWGDDISSAVMVRSTAATVAAIRLGRPPVHSNSGSLPPIWKQTAGTLPPDMQLPPLRRVDPTVWRERNGV
jgi:hypothetical protein